jgi:MtrB/PioB family decaheme-associated outer membrane protein
MNRSGTVNGGARAGKTVLAALALLLLAPGSARGETVDTSRWECNFCPFEDGRVKSEAEAGSLYADGAAARFGEFDGITDEGGYLVLDGSAGARSEDGGFWRVSAEDLGLDNRSIDFAAGKAGRWEAEAAYVAAPYNRYDTTVTPFSAGQSALELPPGWVRAGSTQLMTALDASLRNYDLGTTRERWSLGGRIAGASHWKTELHVTHETRDGNRLRGSNFVTTASQLAAPVDTVTDQIDWTARYATARGSLSLSYFGSFFSDRRWDVAWDNPFTAIAPGADRGRSALDPDNHYNQLGISAVYALGQAWRISFNGSLGQSTQDDAFLPYTANPLIATEELPRDSLDGSVDVTHADLQLSGDLGAQVSWLDGLRGRLGYRYEERDNGTPRADYDYVESDTFPGGVETNLPYGFRRQRLWAAGDWDLARLLWPQSGWPLQLSGEWDHEEWDRTFQEAANSTEDRAWARLRTSPLAWLSLQARYGASNRDTDPYVTDASVTAPQNPLMRKFNLADRERDFWDAGVDLSLPGNVTLSLGGFYREDDYVNSGLGLARTRDSGETADLSWAMSERATVFAFYGRQEVESLQRGSQSFGAPDWQARTRDRFETAAAGVRTDGLRERWNLQFDYFLIDGRGDVTMQSGAAQEFPPLRTRSHGPRLEVEYQATPALGIIGTLRYEHHDAHDWALEGIGPDTLPAVLASGADPYDYDAKLIGLSFRYRFGNDEPAAAPTPEP